MKQCGYWQLHLNQTSLLKMQLFLWLCAIHPFVDKRP